MFPSISFKLQCWLDGAIATAGANFFWLAILARRSTRVQSSDRQVESCLHSKLSESGKEVTHTYRILVVGWGSDPSSCIFQ